MQVTLVGEGPPVVKLAGIAGGVGLCHEEVEAALRAGFRIALLDTTGDPGETTRRAGPFLGRASPGR